MTKIVVLEKGSAVGSHILSGAVFDPIALNELIPDWQTKQAPLTTPVTTDKFWFLTKNNKIPCSIPNILKNTGNYIISLGQLCAWLSEQAEQLGVQVFPGFSAEKILFDDKHEKIIGIKTGDMGIGKNGQPKPHHEPGMHIHATYTVFAEGCRGSLSEQVIKKFNLREQCSHQTYGLGLKEIWEIPDPQHSPGTVIHTVGWPLPNTVYGGAFLYHMKPNLIALGLVVGLDYTNPSLYPFGELQKLKQHPAIEKILRGGRCISYGAKSLNEGGFQSIPKLHFPGGLLVGCSAGFLNVPKIKGSHTALKSGILAAEALFDALSQQTRPATIEAFDQSIKNSWIWKELYVARNIRPAFKYGLWMGLGLSAVELFLLKGKAPWTLQHGPPDHLHLKPTKDQPKLNYPNIKSQLFLDKLTCVNLSNTYHEEDQPVHLTLKDSDVPASVNLAEYDGPEQRYCPAGVYEYIEGKLQINAQNCVHCKTCDIKDPTQNIKWVTPEGSGGPRYPNM